MSISFLSLLKAEVKTSYFLLIPLMTKYPFRFLNPPKIIQMNFQHGKKILNINEQRQ